MALFWRLWAAVALVNTAVLAVFVALATLQFGKIHGELLGERLTVLADRTAAPLESAARIGLPLSAVRTAEAVLERARQADETITAIHVFDGAGEVVHSTTTDPPAAIPPEALAARMAAGGRPWHLQTSDAFLSSIDVAGRDGTAAGGVLVVYPGEGNTTRVQAMAAALALAAIVVLVASAALAAALLRLGLARQIRLFEAIDDAVARSERDSWRSAAGGAPAPRSAADAAGLRKLLDEADARYRSLGAAIAEAGRAGRE